MKDSTILFNASNAGALFDSAIREAFEAMQTGSVVSITHIWVKLPDGSSIKTDPLEYVIR